MNKRYRKFQLNCTKLPWFSAGIFCLHFSSVLSLPTKASFIVIEVMSLLAIGISREVHWTKLIH